MEQAVGDSRCQRCHLSSSIFSDLLFVSLLYLVTVGTVPVRSLWSAGSVAESFADWSLSWCSKEMAEPQTMLLVGHLEYVSRCGIRHRELISVKDPLHALCIESTDPTVVTPQLPMHNRGTVLVQFSMAKCSCRERDSFLSSHTGALH